MAVLADLIHGFLFLDFMILIFGCSAEFIVFQGLRLLRKNTNIEHNSCMRRVGSEPRMSLLEQ